MNRKNDEKVDRRNQEADEAWKEYQKTGQSVSHETMMEWFDTWGTDKEGQCPQQKADMDAFCPRRCYPVAGVHRAAQS